jgi:hypothetical protein
VEVAVKKMIEASLNDTMNSQGNELRNNPAIKRHLELEIEMLQNAPRDIDKPLHLVTK